MPVTGVSGGITMSAAGSGSRAVSLATMSCAIACAARAPPVPGRAAVTDVRWVLRGHEATGDRAIVVGGGKRTVAEVVTGFQVLPSAGTITAGLLSLSRRKNQ